MHPFPILFMPRLKGLLLLLALFSVLTMAAAVYHGLRLRSEALTHHRNMASSLTRVGERELTSTLSTVERLLARYGKNWHGLAQSAQSDKDLRDDIAKLPALRSISLIDADGRVLASSLPGARGKQLSASAIAALMRSQSDVNGGALQISAPWVGRDITDGQPASAPVKVRDEPYFFTFSSPVEKDSKLPASAFSPILVATVNADFFSNMLANMLEQPEFVAELYNYNGLLLVSTRPDVHPPGSSAANQPVFRQWLPDYEYGSLDVDVGTPQAQVLAFRTSRYYPLVLQVELPYQAALSNWQSESRHLAEGVAGTLVFVSLLTWLLYRQQRHRHAVQARVKTEIALAAQVFEDSYDGILVTDADCRILRVNAAFTVSTGYTQAEVQGKTPRLLGSGLHGKDFYKTMWTAVRRDGRWQGEVVNRRKNGQAYHERLAISTVLDARGQVLHYIGMFADISDIKHQESELAQARDRAEAANRAKSQFLAVMSHEIRTPLNGILGMAQLLQMAPASPEEQQDYAATITDSGQVLLTLLNDILDLSKVEAGQMDLLLAPVDPAQQLQDVVTLFAKTAQRKGLALRADTSALPPGVCYQLDAIRLRQMLNNLVSNALKFTSQGEVCLRLQQERREGAQAWLRFSVTDTGIGIASDKLAQLFKPFSQVDSSSTRRFGGTGLGLSIVSSLARLMKGEAGVDSTEGQGSCFWFTLPVEVVEAVDAVEAAITLVEAQPLDVPSAPSAEVPAVATISTGEPCMDCSAGPPRNSVLVVEDNPVNSRFIQLLLERLGCGQVRVVTNGQEALDVVRTGYAPALVLMDCQMPVMDGYEATRQIRHWQQTQREAGKTCPPIAIVALTAAAFDAERDACLAAGMDDFLTKPVVIAALKEVLAHWLPSAATPASPN